VEIKANNIIQGVHVQEVGLIVSLLLILNYPKLTLADSRIKFLNQLVLVDIGPDRLVTGQRRQQLDCLLDAFGVLLVQRLARSL
jgi:hypothetical protein